MHRLPVLTQGDASQGEKDLLGDEEGAVVKEEEFAIVFAAMGVNMETAHFFKQACVQQSLTCAVHICDLRKALK